MDSDHRDLRESIARCLGRDDSTVTRGFDRTWWDRLAEIGIFDLGLPGEGTASYLVTAAAEVGRCGAHGPYGTTMLARCLTRQSGTAPVPVAVAAPLDGGPVPWGQDADVVFAEVDGAWWRCTPVGTTSTVTSSAGERWTVVRLEPVECWGHDPVADALHHLVAAAWAVGRGREAVREAASYAGLRRQFGRRLSDFQAVAHPLAESAAALDGCQAALYRAAFSLDAEGDWARVCSARTIATRTALEAAFVCQQTYGALGFIEEGPLGRTVLQLREVASLPPGDRSADRWAVKALLDGPATRHITRTQEAP